MIEKILSKNEIEYQKLEAVAKILERKSKHNASYVVRDVYLDLGANWMWTTICREGYRECQVLLPREWKEIMIADFSELEEIADEIRAGQYFGDK